MRITRSRKTILRTPLGQAWIRLAENAQKHRFIKIAPQHIDSVFGEPARARFTEYGAVVADLGPLTNLTIIGGDVLILLIDVAEWKHWGWRINRGKGWSIDSIILEA